MELLLIGGLAFMGYELSKTGKSGSKTAKPATIKQNVNEYPFKNDPRLSTNPANNQMNNLEPFFRREGGMGLVNNSDIKSRNMESFTGTDNIEFKSKREQTPLFKPEENRQNIYGTPVMSSNDYNRYKTSTMMNNVSPVEKQQVGPGLNTSSDVSAKGGFHQYFRILPTNVGEYKLNTLEGRVISGKSHTENRSSAVINQEVRKAPSFYEQCERPTMEGRSAYSAPAHQSYVTPGCTNRESSGNHVGIAKGSEALQSTIEGTRVGNIPNQSFPTGGASRENAAAGGYSVANYLVHGSDRENCGIAINANDQNSGNYVKGEQAANMTQREGTSTSYSGAAGFYNNAQSNYNAAYKAEKYHNREDLQVEHTNNPGRMNLREDAYKAVGSMKIREDNNTSRVSTGTVPNSMKIQGKPGRIENVPKITECNPRQDFGLVSQTLQNNPYVHKI